MQKSIVNTYSDNKQTQTVVIREGVSYTFDNDELLKNFLQNNSSIPKVCVTNNYNITNYNNYITNIVQDKSYFSENVHLNGLPIKDRNIVQDYQCNNYNQFNNNSQRAYGGPVVSCPFVGYDSIYETNSNAEKLGDLRLSRQSAGKF